MIEVKKVDNISQILINKVYGRHLYCDFVTEEYSPEYVEKEIQHCLKNGVGFELWKDGEPNAFIIAYKIGEMFFNEKGYYTPELGIHFDGELEVINELLKALYLEMMKEGYTHHVISRSAPANDELWFHMGYGVRVIDVARWAAEEDSIVTLKRIKIKDYENYYPLYKEHNEYMKDSPIFLECNESEEACKKLIEDDSDELYFLMRNEDIIGYTTLNRNKAAGSALFKDRKTLAIKGTHVLEEFQRQGFGKESIKAIMKFARINGFEKIATDFESFNIKAYRFWPRYFMVVAKSYLRYIGKSLEK